MELFGYLAAFLTSVSLIPQVYKIYKTNKTNDLSLIMYLLYTLGVSSWLIYGIHLKSTPMILANSITLLLTLFVFSKIIHNIIMKKRNDNEE